MSRLPEPLERLVVETLARSGLDEATKAEVGADLRDHFREGLEDGRTVEELADRFGDPTLVAPMLRRNPGPPRSVARHGRPDGLLATLRADLRHAVRGLGRAPTFVLATTVVLALGVGANAVVFTVLSELLLRPLPVEAPEELVDVWADIEGGNSFSGISWPDFEVYRSENDVLQELAAFSGARLQLGDDGPVVIASFTTPGYLEMLGLRPALGTLSFDPEAPFGAAPVAVLSYRAWQQSYGGDPGIVGTSIRLNDGSARVIGVGPPGFTGHFIGFPTELWLPLASAPELIGFDPEDPADQRLELIGRRRAGVSVDAVGAALTVIAQQLEGTRPESNRGHGVGVTRTTGLDHSMHAGVTAFVGILTALSLLVLVVACMNVGSMLLVRGMAREREVAVRIALGAGRSRLVRMVLSETTLLALLGAVAGVTAAYWLNGILGDAIRRNAPGLGLDLAFDWRVFSLTALAALAAIAVTAVAPTVYILAKSPAGVLRSRGGKGSGGRMRSMLVVGQVAVSVVLVLATGLFVRAVAEGEGLDPGFDADQVAFVPLDFGEAGLDVDTRRELLRRVQTIPGVQAASLASGPPIGVGRSPLEIDLPGVPPPPGFDRHVVDHRRVLAGYVGASGLSLLSGRDFEPADNEDGTRVAVVNEAFRARYLQGREAIGATFGVDGEPVAIVGVVADARFVVQDPEPDPLLLLADGVGPTASGVVVLRGADPRSLDAAVSDAVGFLSLERDRVRLTTAREVLDDALLPQRMAVRIVGGMGLAALLLATVGLYGLIQFNVSRDTRELGIRLALGGRPTDLARVVLSKGFTFVLLGTALGVAGALLFMPALGSFLGPVSPRDPATYVVVSLCFAAASALASWLPARRALRIEPTVALREE